MPFNKDAYSRYVIIDKCLTNRFHTYPTMDDILEACEIGLSKTFSVSAIQKDIKTMKEDEAIGFMAPICYSRLHNGYYYSDPEYSIHSIPLNSSELEALEAVADVLTMFTGSRISDNYNQAVHKIFSALKEKNLQFHNKPRVIHTDTQVQHKGFVHFEFFMHAIINKIPVNFIHYSYLKRCFNSIIAHPLLLKEFQNNWYVIAYSEQHKSIRTFGLDRIHDPLFLKIPFTKTPIEKFNSFFENIYGVYPITGAKLQKIEFRTDALIAEYLKANPIHTSQKIINIGEYGGTSFELKLVPSQELLNFFLQFSPNIVIISPENLHQKVLDMLEKAQKLNTFNGNYEVFI